MDVRKVVLFVAFSTCCVQQAGTAEKYMFTSYANLLKLYYMEEECLSNVDVFLREELAQHGDVESAEAAHGQNLTSLRKLVEEAKAVHKAVGGRSEEYLSHPVNVYRLARRLLPGWRDAISVIRKSKACREWHIPHVLSRLANMEENLPTEDDIRSLGYSLITIQHTQGLRTADIINGKIGNHTALSPLSPEEQFEIVKLAVDEDDYYYAAQWLKHMVSAGNLAQYSKENHGFNATNLLGMLASAYFRINMVPEALKATKELLKTDPDNMVAKTNKAYFEDRMKRKGTEGSGSQKPIRYGKEDPYLRSYEALCRGTRPRKNRNKCRLLPTKARLSFYKMEVLRQRPPIIAFHDVIPDQYTQEIVSISEKEYEKAALDEDFRTPDFTLVLSTVADNRQRRILSKISKRLLDLPYTVTPPFETGEGEARNLGHQGLYVKPASDFQVQSLGGHTASFIVFLNDVEMGGDIVFPSANVRLAPKKGTVLFYFPSMRKFHAVCPVAYGTEWLAFQSFYEKPARGICRLHELPSFWPHAY